MIIQKKFLDMNELFDTIFSNEIKYDFCILGKYDTAKIALKNFIIQDNMMPYGIDISEQMWDGYDKEFIVTSLGNDVICSKLYGENGYLYFYNKVVFVMPDCSEECIEFVKNEECSDLIYIVDFLKDARVDNDKCIDINLTITDMNIDLIKKLLLNLGAI